MLHQSIPIDVATMSQPKTSKNSAERRKSAAATKVCSLFRRRCSVSWPVRSSEPKIIFADSLESTALLTRSDCMLDLHMSSPLASKIGQRNLTPRNPQLRPFFVARIGLFAKQGNSRTASVSRVLSAQPEIHLSFNHRWRKYLEGRALQSPNTKHNMLVCSQLLFKLLVLLSLFLDNSWYDPHGPSSFPSNIFKMQILDNIGAPSACMPVASAMGHSGQLLRNSRVSANHRSSSAISWPETLCLGKEATLEESPRPDPINPSTFSDSSSCFTRVKALRSGLFSCTGANKKVPRFTCEAINSTVYTLFSKAKTVFWVQDFRKNLCFEQKSEYWQTPRPICIHHPFIHQHPLLRLLWPGWWEAAHGFRSRVVSEWPKQVWVTGRYIVCIIYTCYNVTTMRCLSNCFQCIYYCFWLDTNLTYAYNDFTLLHYVHLFMFIAAFGKTIQTKVAILLSSDLTVSAVNGCQVTCFWISSDLAAFLVGDSPTASTMDLFQVRTGRTTNEARKYGFQRFRKPWHHALLKGENGWKSLKITIKCCKSWVQWNCLSPTSVRQAAWAGMWL